MSVIKLTKKDIIKKDDEDKKIKLNRNQISYDSALVSGWETDADESFGTLQKYREKLDKGEYLSSDDLNSYKSAMDRYIENSNRLRGLNKTLGKGFTEEEEKQWNDSVTSFQTNYDDVFNYYSKWKTEDEYNQWYESYKKSLEEAERLKELANSEQASQGWGKYIEDEAKSQSKKPSAWQEAIIRGFTTASDNPVNQTFNNVVYDYRNDDSYKKPNDDWTEEQKNIFGALYLSDLKEAEKYAVTVNNSINVAKEQEAIKKIQESATSNFWVGAGNTLGAIASSPFGLADYMDDLAKTAAGRPITSDGFVSPFEYSQAVTEGISTNLNEMSGTLNENIPIIGGKGLGDVYGLGTSIAQSLASAYTLGASGTLISYFGQGAASGVDDALSRGATEGQAVLYGTSLGVFEGLAEMVGIDNLFKLGSSATIKGFIKNILNQAGAEGAEEGLTSLFSNIADNVIMQDKSNFNTLVTQYMAQGMSESEAKKKAWMNAVEGIAFDTIAGAVSGGVSGSLHTSVANIIANKEASQLYGNGAELVTEAKEIGGEAGTLADKYQAKLDKGKSLSGGQINRLVEANENAMVSQDKAKMQTATETRLTELGENGDISSIAKVIIKQALGEKLTKSEKALLQNSKYGQRVVNEITPSNVGSGEYSNAWAENIGTERINTEEYNLAFEPENSDEVTKKALLNVATTTPFNTNEEINATETNISLTEEKAIESKFEVSDEGKTLDKKSGEIVSIKNIESISSDGEAKLALDGGMVVKASDLSFGSDAEALFVENIGAIKIGKNPISTASANALYQAAMTSFKANPNMSASEAMSLIRGLTESYIYGTYNFGRSKLSAKSEDGTAVMFAGELSQSQRAFAYELGAKDSASKTEADQKVIDDLKAKGKPSKKSLGKVIFEKGANVDESTLTATQKANLDGIKLLAEVSSVEFHVFRSEKVGNTFKYTMPDGTVVSANGWFVAGTNEIWVDLNAGNFGEGTMIRTAAHEISHYIKQWSPQKWRAMADLLMKSFAENDVDTESMLNKQIAKIKKRYTKKNMPSDVKLLDMAYEELVSDALTDMLTDGSIVNFIAEVKAKDRNLAQKILDAIKSLLKKWGLIIDDYKGRELDTPEAQALSQLEDTFKKLQEMYQEAFMDANEVVALTNDIANIDADSKSVSPMMSERTWTESEYVTEREKTAKAIASALGVDIKTAYKYIDDINSVARLIADDRVRLDYDPNIDENATVLKKNSDYKYSVDMSTLCAKRLLTTGTFDAIQRRLPNTVFTSEDIVALREMMLKRGYEVACGICYVESTRREMGRITQDFINSYIESQKTGKPITRINSSGQAVDLKKTKDEMLTTADKSANKFYADKNYTPTLADLNTTDIDLVKRDHPLVYEAYLNFMNARGQAKPKLLETRAEYKGEILKHFKTASAVNARNRAGGLRLQSFSDFEVPHLIDMMQIVMDMSRVGLMSQAYTKVPAFAEVFGNTGVKINLSLIAKDSGLDAKGNLIFDDVEGINHEEAFRLRDKFSKNVGTILVGKTDAHIIAAMADPRIDYIIPFHKSSWKESLYDALGLTGYADYTDTQNEKPIDKDRKIKNFEPSEYWDFTKSGDENAQTYLAMCLKDGRIPKFPQFQGYPGYWKLLIDFKMYDNDGVGSPQEVVRPTFEMDAANKILDKYKGGHKSFPVAKDVVEDFVSNYANNIKFSERDLAPTFYSQMGKVVEGVKQEKLAANSVVNMLRGKGVKAEEIRWSGIVPFLEGKKSVTKAELQEFIANNMLQIEESQRGNDADAEKLESLMKDVFEYGYNPGDFEDIISGQGYSAIERLEDVLKGMVADQEIGQGRAEEIISLANKIYDSDSMPTKWERYKLDGGTNYREIVFTMPNSSYSNQMMRAHWGEDAEGILAHARIQDFDVDGKKMLFIEEIQSDWHNEGHKEGYKGKKRNFKNPRLEMLQESDGYHRGKWALYDGNKYIADSLAYTEDEAREFLMSYYGEGDVPDAPFSDNYHEYVLKRLLRMAAEKGYDSIGWTTADIQSERWSDEFAEGYRIEYDQDIPKFLKKYGKQWGAKVEKTVLDDESQQSVSYVISTDIGNDGQYYSSVEEAVEVLVEETNENFGTEFSAENVDIDEWDDVVRVFDEETGDEIGTLRVEYGTPDSRGSVEVWSMDITDSMKNSVLYEGQVMYSERDSEGNVLSEGQQEFFKDSKVRDAKGNLLVVYHGTKEHFTVFDKSKLDDGLGFFFTEDKREASEYGTPLSAYLNITNPFDMFGDTPLEDFLGNSPRYVDGHFNWEAAVNGLVDAGYDGAYSFSHGIRWYIAFSPEQIKDIDNKTPTTNPDIRYSERDPSTSNRSILADALESVAANEIERRKLTEYKKKISLIEAEEQRLSEIQKQLFTKGGVEPEKRKDLQFEAKQIANRINTYDRQLLNLESTTALKNVLNREKALAMKRQKQKDAEAMKKYKEKVAKTQRELLERNQESRKKAIEGREKTAMRHKIQKVVSELNQLLLRGTKDKHVMIGLQKVVAEALDAVNMDTVSAEERIKILNEKIAKAKDPDVIASLTETRDRIQAQGDKMSDKLTDLKNAYNDIKNSDDPLIANSYDEVIASRLEYITEKVGNTPLRNMTLEQLEDVYDMYKMVLTTIRNSNKAFKNAKNESIATLGNRVMMEVEEIGGKKKYRLKGTEGIENFNWNNLKPIYAFSRIGSNTLAEVFNNVRAGEDTWAVDVTEAREFYLEQSKKYNYDSWDFNKQHNFTSTSGLNFELSLEQIMSLYAYSKREQAAEHLRMGGIVFDETTEVTIKNKLGIPLKFNPTEATAYNLSIETLADIVGKLTEEQKAFVDEMQSYLSTEMGEKGNEVSLEMYGVKLFKEKNYFPLKSATQFMAKAKEQQKGEIKIKNSGFSKETVQHANNPIVLTPFMDVWANHVNEMSMYHAFVLPMEDFYRVFNYKTPTSDTMATESVEMFIQNAYGKGAVDYIDQLLKDLNGGAISDPRETYSKALMSKFKKAAVMASLSVVVQQPTAMVRAMALVDMRHFGIVPIARGIVRTVIPKKHKTLWAEVKKYAPVAIIKEMGRFDTHMGRSVQDFVKAKEYKGLEKVKGFFTDSGYRDDVFSKLPALADEMAWVSIWEAVKRETVAQHKNLRPNSEEFLKVVGERFTEVITKTQVYDSVLSRSAFMRSKTAFMNMWTSFLAEPTTSINMLEDALRQGKRGNKKYAAKTIGAVYGSIMLNAMLVSLVYAARDDDEDETFTEKYLSRLTTELLDGIIPITYLPLWKDAWSIAQGFDIERADMSLFADLVDTLQQSVKVISKDTNDMDEEELAEHQKEVADALWGIADSISSLCGLPTKNVRRDINGAINLFETLKTDVEGRKTTAGSLIDEMWEDVKSSIPVVGWLPNETKADKLYDAIVSGDTAYIERLKSGYKDDKAYETAVRKALRDNDPRIKEAAELRKNGEVTECFAIVDKIANEGHFKRTLVISAVNSELEKLKKAEK